MKIIVYAKLDESLALIDRVVEIIKKRNDELYITTENKRSFTYLENIKEVSEDNIYVIGSISSLGISEADIASQLSWFIDNGVKLVISDINTTYTFGITQPLNQAILSTVLQNLLSKNSNIVSIPSKRGNSGRNRLPFPDNWDDLYERWENNEISSKDFIEASGLKKATFYNLISEYKSIQEQNNEYMKRYRIIGNK